MNTTQAPSLQIITLNINGKSRQVAVAPHWTLSEVLRSKLGLTGSKEACGEGACGACTVQMDGLAVLSCMMLAVECQGRRIETIESLNQSGGLHPLQEAWLEEYAAQCGYCSPGMIMSSKWLLETNPSPTAEDVKEALGGNICICANYEHIIKAVESAAVKMKEAKHV